MSSHDLALQEVEEQDWPHVEVIVESKYRVLDADPFDGEPLLAEVHTEFGRVFSWGRNEFCQPASVSVAVTPKCKPGAGESGSTPDVSRQTHLTF